MQRYGCMECGWDGAKQSRFGLLHDFIPQQVLSEPPPSTSHLQKTTLTTDNTPSTTPTQTKRHFHWIFITIHLSSIACRRNVRLEAPLYRKNVYKTFQTKLFPHKDFWWEGGRPCLVCFGKSQEIGSKGEPVPPSTDWQLTRALISPVDLQFFNDGDDDQLFDHYDISDEVWCKHINFVSSWISFSIVS